MAGIMRYVIAYLSNLKDQLYDSIFHGIFKVSSVKSVKFLVFSF